MAKRAGPTAELSALKTFLQEIEKKFLSHHLTKPSLATPTRAEALDVAAFVVLAHGAMENFVEGMGLWVLERVENTWRYKQNVTKCMASLLLHHPAPGDGGGLNVYNLLRTQVEKAKADAAKQIGQNNGIAVKHLRAIFLPLGINVTDDPVLMASLEMLVKLRHQWAHQYRFGAKNTKSAQDAKQIVADCVNIAEKLAADARTARP